MVAVGLWGAFLGPPAIWLLPIVFPMVMAFGGALGVIGIPIPFIETGIAVSAIVLGLMVAFAVRPPLWIAAVIVGHLRDFPRSCPRHRTARPQPTRSPTASASSSRPASSTSAVSLWAFRPAGRRVARSFAQAASLIAAVGAAFLTTG